MKRLFLMLTLLSASVAFAQTAVVTPVNTQGWVFMVDNAAGQSSGQFVNGPATPPLGTGSAQLATTSSTGGHVLGTMRYAGTRLADVTELKYSSIGNLTPQAIAFQFDVDSDLTDANDGFQGRLVFEPYQAYGNGAIVPNVWAEWNVLQGRWWGSGNPATRPTADKCPQSNPCTTAQVLTLFPNVGIKQNGGVYFKAGSGWSSPFTGSVDKFIIGIASTAGTQVTTWDFELNSMPTSAEQCKNGGYLLFNPPSGPFKNQGECVASVQSNAPNH